MRLNDAFHPQREEGIQCQAGVEAELVNEFIAYKQWTRTFLHDWLSLLCEILLPTHCFLLLIILSM